MKLGFEYGFLYDLRAMYEVTINGQLNLLMLIEDLELAGIHVISANTDGIVSKVFKQQEDEYYSICKKWVVKTKFDLDYTIYKKYVRLNVNSYISIKEGNKVKTKNDFTYDIQINKGYYAPAIAKTLYEYYVNDNTDIESIIKTFDIYDYCISVKVGKQFRTELHTIKGSKENIEILQKDNRYFISKTGGVLLKYKYETSKYTNVIKGKYVTIFNTYYKSDNYNIDYNWYLSKIREKINKINGEIYKDMKKTTGSMFDMFND